MQIKRLELFTDAFATQLYFYKHILKVPTKKLNEHQFCIQTHNTVLVFTACRFPVNYHFAFLIDEFYFEDALEAVRATGVPMIYNEDGSDIITWADGGRTFYFRDADNNIGEFITRPNTGTQMTINGKWNFSQLFSINEIGTPSPSPKSDSEKWISEFELDVPEKFKKRHSDNFCWTGDLNGTLLIVAENRNWYLTRTRAVSSPLKVEIKTIAGLKKLQFVEGKLTAQ